MSLAYRYAMLYIAKGPFHYVSFFCTVPIPDTCIQARHGHAQKGTPTARCSLGSRRQQAGQKQVWGFTCAPVFSFRLGVPFKR